MDKKLFNQIYDQIYEYWKLENQNPDNLYTKREWIFPYHIDLVIQWSKKLSKKYNADEEVCIYAALFHDIGLVYKREKNTSPKGHEKRSLEYADFMLNKYNFDNDKKENILNCIKATQSDYDAKTIEEKIVSTADFVAQFKSIHYFAKAVFADDINYFVKWFKKRIEEKFDKKIYFEDIKKELEPIRKHYLEIIDLYNKS